MSGFSGTTLVRSINGFCPIKDIEQDEPVLCTDGDYGIVNHLVTDRADKILSVDVDGLSCPVLATPDSIVTVFRRAVQGKAEAFEQEQIQAFDLTVNHMVACPIQRPMFTSVYDEDLLIRHVGLLGAFYAGGTLLENKVVFLKSMLNDVLLDVISYLEHEVIRKDGSEFVAISDGELTLLVQQLFGVSGTGPLTPLIFSLDKQVTQVFAGGLINVLGMEQENGVVLCSFSNPNKAMEVLELFWNAGFTGKIIRPTKERPVYIVATLKTKHAMNAIAENTGELAKADTNYPIPFVVTTGSGNRVERDSYVLLPVMSISLMDWNRRPVYELVVRNAAYAVSMISVQANQVGSK